LNTLIHFKRRNIPEWLTLIKEVSLITDLKEFVEGPVVFEEIKEFRSPVD